MLERKTSASRASSSERVSFPAFYGYEEHGVMPVPIDVPELGVKEGTMGTIAGVYGDGRLLDLEITRDDGTSVGFIDLRVEENGTTHVVGVSPLASD